MKKLIVFIGGNGAGKDFTVKSLNDNHQKVITTTTRDKREGEKDKIHYNFVCKNIFQELITKSWFLEYNEYDNEYYGSNKFDISEIINKDKIPVLILEVNGLYQLLTNILDGCFNEFSLDVEIVVFDKQRTENFYYIMIGEMLKVGMTNMDPHANMLPGNVLFENALNRLVRNGDNTIDQGNQITFIS